MNQHKLCQNFSQKTKNMTRRSGYKEKFKKKMFPDVLAAKSPNLVQKEQNQNKLEIFIDNNSIATECIF